MDMELEQDVMPSDNVTNLIANAANAEQDSKLSGATPGDHTPKSNRGRKKGGKNKPRNTDPEIRREGSGAEPSEKTPGPQIPTSVICLPVVKLISNAGVSYTGEPRAAMSAKEAEDVANAMGMVADKYLPEVMAKYGAEAMLALSLGQWGMRLVAIKKLQYEQAKARGEVKPQGQARPQATDSADIPFPVEESPLL